MNWKVSISEQAQRELKKMDRQDRELILSYLETRIDGCADPRLHGEALKQNLTGYWRYRIGKYRILCELVDDIVMVYVIKVEHRRSEYLK